MDSTTLQPDQYVNERDFTRVDDHHVVMVLEIRHTDADKRGDPEYIGEVVEYNGDYVTPQRRGAEVSDSYYGVVGDALEQHRTHMSDSA